MHCFLACDAPFSTRHMQENSVLFTMLCVENKLFLNVCVWQGLIQDQISTSPSPQSSGRAARCPRCVVTAPT